MFQCDYNQSRKMLFFVGWHGAEENLFSILSYYPQNRAELSEKSIRTECCFVCVCMWVCRHVCVNANILVPSIVLCKFVKFILLWCEILATQSARNDNMQLWECSCGCVEEQINLLVILYHMEVICLQYNYNLDWDPDVKK